MHIAVSNRSVAAVRELLQLNCDVSLRDEVGSVSTHRFVVVKAMVVMAQGSCTCVVTLQCQNVWILTSDIGPFDSASVVTRCHNDTLQLPCSLNSSHWSKLFGACMTLTRLLLPSSLFSLPHPVSSLLSPLLIYTYHLKPGNTPLDLALMQEEESIVMALLNASQPSWGGKAYSCTQQLLWPIMIVYTKLYFLTLQVFI